MSTLRLNKLRKKAPSNYLQKPKKKVDRFDGLTEEDLQSCKLPDILGKNLDMVFVGINPSLTAAYRGRYYAGPGNHFYKLLHESKLTPRLFTHDDDSKLLDFGIGLTNIVERPTRSSSDLKKSEIKEGAKKVEEKLIEFQPKIAIFNGKGIYEVFSNKTSKSDFSFGLQPVRIGNTAIWVVPSSSARCAHFPRMVDKLHFYSALKKYLLHLNGEISDVDEREFSFEGKCRIFDPTTSKMWRRKEVSAFMHGGRVANKATLLNYSGSSITDLDSPEYGVKKIKIETNDGEIMRCEDSCDGDESRKECTKDSDNFLEDKSETLEEEKKPTKVKHEVDFVDLIKQRLSQKEDDCDKEGDEEETSTVFRSVTRKKPVTKLKYSMLKKNRSSSSFGIQKTCVNSSDSDAR